MGNTKEKEPLKVAIGNRLRQIRKYYGHQHVRMASLIGVSMGALKKNEAGLTFPSLRTLFSLNNQFGVSIEWLLFNRGPMLLKDRDQKVVEQKTGDNIFTQEVEEMAFLMERIPLMRHSVMGYFQEFKVNHKDLIREELDKIANETREE